MVPSESWYIVEAFRTVHVCGKPIILSCAYAGVYKVSHFKMSFTFSVQDWDCYLLHLLRTKDAQFFPLLPFSVNEKDMTSSILFKKWIGEIKAVIRFNLDRPDRDT